MYGKKNNVIKLNEQQLHNIISRSINQILSENSSRTRRAGFQDRSFMGNTGKCERLSEALARFLKNTSMSIGLRFRKLVEIYAKEGVNIEPDVQLWSRAVTDALYSKEFVSAIK